MTRLAKQLQWGQPVGCKGSGGDLSIEIFDDIGKASNKDEIFGLLRQYFRDLGFHAMGYMVPSANEPGRVKIEAEGFPVDFAKLYLERKLDAVDPFPRHVARSGRPLRLSRISEETTLTPEQREFVETSRSFGVTDGFLIPTFGMRQHLGLFGLGQVVDLEVLDKVSVSLLQAVAQAAHTQLDLLAFQTQSPRPLLSQREVSILHWIAAGKTNGEIANILGIKPPTVATYIKRVFYKLDVSDRSAAATRAVKLGIIDIH